MTLFLLIGALGLVIIIGSLILGDLIPAFGDGLDIGGIFSGPVIGAFLAAFGFGGALILNATSASSGVAALGGLACGAVIGGASLAVTRSLMAMPTDATLKSEDVVGATATVITRIPEGGMGEISVSFGGQALKLGARSSQAIAAGTPVIITASTSSSSVVVEAATIPPSA